MTDDQLKAEIARVINVLNGSEIELANAGSMCSAGACAAGRHMIAMLATKLFPEEKPNEAE